MNHSLQVKLALRRQVRESPPIAGFSYPFCRLLLRRLIELFDQGKAIDQQEERLTGEAQIIVDHLTKQIFPFEDDPYPIGRYANKLEVFVKEVESFLMIFGHRRRRSVKVQSENQ